MLSAFLRKHLARPDFRLNLGIMSCLLLGNAIFLNFNAFRGFNFFDFGAFMDAAWRVVNGQRPYIDFIYFTGPVHLYVTSFFYAIFGFGQLGVLMNIVVIHSIVILLSFLLAKK